LLPQLVELSWDYHIHHGRVFGSSCHFEVAEGYREAMD
jgi:hypothetical protein